MARIIWVMAALLAVLTWATAAPALTPEEVIELKKAGVSDEVIQKMLDQESAGASQQGPVKDEGGMKVFSAGENSRQRAQENAEHERWKEEKAMDAAGNVIIDGRPYMRDRPYLQQQQQPNLQQQPNR